MVRVFNHWFSPRKAFYFFAEETVLVLALLAGASLGPVAAQATGATAPIAPAVLRAGLASLFFAGALYLGDLYDLHAAVRDRADGRRLLRALGVATIALAVADLSLHLVLPGWMLHRSVVLAAAGGALGVIGARALMPAVVGAPTRVLFLGAGPRARDLARAVEREADGLWAVAGFVVPEGSRAPAVVPPEALRQGAVLEVVRQARAQVVVVAMEDRREGLPVDALLALRTRGLRVVDDVGFAEATLQRIPLALVRPSALIFDEGFRVSRLTRTVKRALDLGVSAVGLLIGAPVMAAVAAAIWLSDGRPVLYSQERTGRGGRAYRIWKFRTMRRDAEKLGAAWATDDDPRVLPVGRFLRRARLDELPQLWNVLGGQMSLVGPRPERAVFLSELKARWPLFALRELVKPGLTGWAQLRYGYGSTMEEQAKKLEYDLYYIKNTTLFLDLVCLLATAKVVLLGRGAR
ncbi:exopolysaccharide biosynthesis polyprenyl glycosylphosphotransferase [Anaeromyxobacter sp. K]|uniref:exopolysaccharide biosynthesis polyprenyl glycosylphosphotransferase n=1 Tax=Anaeromyxobacter sp. (strain K) TaxID=447217 RepID=UPI00017BE353|nr:exopolysaccharide biosynthesis polyprenyl glycosylphosphotransferase [Anaeromyxobacter sp. K]ACG73958.1 exopolysaccharide biosynthesis polyprenyl glycosylphosphotransferase [Anaeromyxobacter sp. K]